MKRLCMRSIVICAAALLLFTGCRQSAPAVSDIQDDQPAVIRPDTYTGPSPMPPPENFSAIEGKILWPIRQDMDVEAYDGGKSKYGFINERGEQVLPMQYIRFRYSKDSEGKYAYLAAGCGDHTDFYTLDGKKVLTVAAEHAWVVDGTSLIYAELHTNTEAGGLDPDTRVTVYDLDSGERLLQEDYFHVSVRDDGIILATDTQHRAYYIDPAAGEDHRVLAEKQNDDETILPEQQEEGWIDGVYYYKGQAIEALPSRYAEIIYAEWPVVVARTPYPDREAYFLNMETGIGVDMDEPHGDIFRIADWYVNTDGYMSDMDVKFAVYDENGSRQTDTVFDRYPSAIRFLQSNMHISADMPYLYITTTLYQGYIDREGKWLYRGSRFQALLD